VHRRHLGHFAAAFPRAIAATAGQPFRAFATRLAGDLVAIYEAQAPIHRALWWMRTAADLHGAIEEELGRMVELGGATLTTLGVVADPVQARGLAFVIVHAVDGVANAAALHPGTVEPRLIAELLADVVATYVERVQGSSQPGSPSQR
jgi:hypothetical protein